MTPQPSEQPTGPPRYLTIGLPDRLAEDRGESPVITIAIPWSRIREAVEASGYLIVHAVAAAPDPVASPLDVERLAGSLDVLSEDGDEYALMAPEDREYRYEAAERLIAEYARLGQPVAEEPA